MTFASLREAGLRKAVGMPPQYDKEPTTIYRWMTKTPAAEQLFVTAMNPGAKKLKLSVAKVKSDYHIDVVHPDGTTQTIRLGKTLKLRS